MPAHATREVEVAWPRLFIARSFGAELADELASGGEDLHAVVASVSDVDVAASRVHSFRIAELSISVTIAAPVSAILASEGKDGNAVLRGDEELVTKHADTRGPIKLA